jgi:hypothetical protein
MASTLAMVVALRLDGCGFALLFVALLYYLRLCFIIKTIAALCTMTMAMGSA